MPENRAVPGGQTLRLAVAVIKTQQPNPAPDPWLMLNGGPGAPALSNLERFIGLFHATLQNLDRDVILFDQRGVGLSQPALECPELAPMLLAQAHDVAQSLAEMQAPYRACRDRWTAQGVDLAAYTTTASAADVNDLWHALGYPAVNLYGVSYGTLLAQTVVRDYPTGVRSVVLDSAYPLEISLLADTASNLAQALERVFAECAAEAVCNALYPDLPNVYQALVAQHQQKPTILTLHGPVRAADFTVTYDAADLVNDLLSTPPQQIPALIYDVHEGQYASLIHRHEAALKAFYQNGPPPSRAMAYSVMCSQGTYAATAAQVAALAHYPEGGWAERFIQRDLLPLPCAEWAPAATLDIQPARSAIPTLILSGADDASRTPAYDTLLAANFSQAFLVVIPNVGHGVATTGNPCVNGLARAFLAAPTERPNTQCFTTLRPTLLAPRFAVRAAVTHGPVQWASGLLGVGLLLAVGYMAKTRRIFQMLHVPLGFTWRSSWQAVGWVMPMACAATLAFAMYASHTGVLRADLVPPPQVIAFILPLFAAVQAAFLLSPDDEPALELWLTLPRPLSWTLLERSSVLIIVYSVIGLLAAGVWRTETGETWGITIWRWWPVLVLCTSLAASLTLTLRRAIVGLMLVILLGLGLTMLGDLMVERWPFLWPAHFYLAPTHPEYALNRLWLSLGGLGLLAYAALAQLRNPESVLFGKRPVNKATRKPVAQENARPQRSISRPTALPVSPYPPLAIAYYELLLHTRRPSFFILIAALLTPTLLGALLAREQMAAARAAVVAGTLAPEIFRQQVTTQLTLVVWFFTAALLLFMLPMLLADTVSKDRQLGVRELLESLPVATHTYLTGKLWAVWGGVLLALALVLNLTALVWHGGVGPFDQGLFAEMALLGLVPLALTQASLGVLLAAGQPTNRRAALVGLGLAALTGVGLIAGFAAGEQWWNYFNPGRPLVLLYYWLGWPGASAGAPPQTLALFTTLQKLTSWHGALLTQLANVFTMIVIWAAVRGRGRAPHR